MPTPQPVLLYDGECGLCNACVRWLLRVDERGVLRFAPLQSAPGQEFLRAHGLATDDFDTLIFVPDWGRPAPAAYLVRTDGVLAACAAAGGVARELANLRVLPRGLRDAGYKTIARLRYALFGRYVPVPLPRAEWERRFLAR
ncbi:MAG: DCC1-like thiol-disulfide oxidoreductase family protein [Candidatus Didemnitutus sp.]|nr:DCC1-like thiol-disulfide oxidoreductase family protein [Candidatus Didemnitutus sp.]